MLERRFAGFSGPEGPVPGVADGVQDVSYRYRVAIASDQLPELTELLREACVMFDQRWVYLRGPDGEVHEIRPEED
jgi:hypothetical protein